MQLQIKHGNALDAEEEAICITIDGAGPGMEGNLARQLAFRWPLLWQEIVREIRYPLPPGGVFEFVVPEEYVDCAFRLIVLASTLHHEHQIDHSERGAVVQAAVSNILRLLPRYGLCTCATTLMKGGWRMSLDQAFLAMSAVVSNPLLSDSDVSLSIYALNENEFEQLKGIAFTLGWR